MSRIAHLKLVIESKKTLVPRAALLHSLHSNNRLNVSWLTGKTTAPGTLDIDAWLPLRLEITDSLDKTNVIVFKKENPSSWVTIFHKVMRKRWQEEEADAIESEDIDAGWVRAENEPLGKIRGCDYYHKAIKDIIKKYHDICNAVLIFPGSDLDNKLQEAYYSKKTKPGKAASNG